MKRHALLLGALLIALLPLPASAQEKLVVSIWGGSWRDLVAETAAKKFKQQTGADVEFITGGTIDRLNKAKLAKGSPESDITFTTSHVGWLYANDGLFETLDLSKIPNAKSLVDQAMITPARAGPIMRARLNEAELRPIAFGICSRVTISLTNAWRAFHFC